MVLAVAALALTACAKPEQLDIEVAPVLDVTAPRISDARVVLQLDPRMNDVSRVFRVSNRCIEGFISVDATNALRRSLIQINKFLYGEVIVADTEVRRSGQDTVVKVGLAEFALDFNTKSKVVYSEAKASAAVSLDAEISRPGSVQRRAVQVNSASNASAEGGCSKLEEVLRTAVRNAIRVALENYAKEVAR